MKDPLIVYIAGVEIALEYTCYICDDATQVLPKYKFTQVSRNPYSCIISL